jgi:hypothetical protein
MVRHIRSVFLLLGSVVFLFACSRSEPKITYGTMRLVYYQTEGKPLEQFSFFVLPDDDDGIEDLAELNLYHDREGLYWSLGSENWITVALEEQTWIGSRSITMLDGEELPRGQYRAELVDKGGERSERLFTFDAPADARYPFPFLHIENGEYWIESGYPEHFFICYDNEGTVVQTIALERVDGSLAELALPGTVRGLALWAEDSEYSTSALTDIVSIR